jgi:hypothetical protein
MDSRFSNFRRLLIVAAAVTAASFAQAQSFMRPGEAIIFSAPDDGDAASNAPSLSARPPSAPGFGDTIHAPDVNFQNPDVTSVQPPAPQQSAISAAEADRRKNWALMTPAEILGVDTPEKILKIPERDAAGQRKNSTALERYYERQNAAQTNGSGGLFPGMASSRTNNFPDSEASRLNANVFNPSDDGFGNTAQPADPFQKPASGIGAVANQNGDSGWSKIFISPPTPVQTPAQDADMAEFQKLLEPNQPSSSASPGGGLFSAPQIAPVSTFGQPMNPVATPFGQINGGIGGLPGGSGQNALPVATPAPDWKPQLPPWMLKGPQPGVVPQRKF